jgi:hypothetical protein
VAGRRVCLTASGGGLDWIWGVVLHHRESHLTLRTKRRVVKTKGGVMSQDTDIPSRTDFSAPGPVFRYRVFEGPIALVWFGYLVGIAAWIALVYLGLPRLWEWLVQEALPFDQSKIAPYQDYIAWVFAGLLALLGFVVIPLTRAFGIREIAFAEGGIAFRDRLGRERTVISRLSAVKSRQKMTVLQGSDMHGHRVRQLVARNRLGREQYRAFLERLEKQEGHVV